MGRPRTGKPRGRPPYPELLTPAEARVLDALKAERTNAEIAIQLGVSPETVKTHVSNILAKADATSREELLAWEPPGHRRFPVLRGITVLTALIRPRRAVPVFAGMVVVAAVGASIRFAPRAGDPMAAPVAGSVTASRTAIPQPASPSATPTPAPARLSGDAVVDRLLAQPVAFEALAPGERCPVTPTASFQPLLGDGSGDGPVYVTGLAPGVIGPPWAAGRTADGRYLVKTVWDFDIHTGRPVIVRGTRVDGPGSVAFEDGDTGRLESYRWLAGVSRTANVVDVTVMAFSSTGCFGLEIDTPDSTDVLYVEITESGGSAITWDSLNRGTVLNHEGDVVAAVVWPDGLEIRRPLPPARPVTLAGRGWHQLALSADGRTLAATREVRGRILLYTFDLATTAGLTLVADDTDFNGRPEWSPDGKLLYEAQAGIHRQLRLALPTPVTLTPPDYTSWMGAWSPDGSQIAYCSDREDGWRIWVMRDDGSDPRRITDGPGSDCAPRWSADGSRIGFKSNRDGPVEEWSVPAGGGTATKGRSD